MSTPVVMPQMGESIAEGTIVRWIKKVGDSVDRDEPLFEISTDKVDAEIPAPAAGVLTEIKVQEGETVAVNAVVATIGDAVRDRRPAVRRLAARSPSPRRPPHRRSRGQQCRSPQADGAGPAQKKVPPTPKPNGRESAAHASAPHLAATLNQDEVRRQKSSPLVRRIAKEHNVDVSQIHGSGLGGRVTKHDILEFIESGASSRKPRARSPKPRAREPKAPEPRAQSPEPRAPRIARAIASRSSRSR